jgi:signal transduction histidine kinase
MKIFVYKTLIVMFFLYFVLELTIGNRINNYEKKIENLTSMQYRQQIITKIKSEIEKANEKENYFTEEEKILISTFIEKIKKELAYKD